MSETGVDRIGRTFADAGRDRRTLLVAYLMAGDPSVRTSADLALGCIAGGFGMIELGVPFSDPIADGPVIAQAGQRAIAALGGRTSVEAALEVAELVRRERRDVPIVLMGYANSFLAAARGGSGDDLAGRLEAAGVDGVLIPDLPHDHEPALREAFVAQGIATPVLVAPTTTRERGAAVAAAATGFVYYVSVTGVTGTDRPDVAATYDHVTRIREHTALPVVVGFGIQTADQVRSLRGAADGLVVGSALVARAHAAPPGHEVAGIGALAAELAAAAGAAPSGQHTMGNVKEDVAC